MLACLRSRKFAPPLLRCNHPVTFPRARIALWHGAGWACRNARSRTSRSGGNLRLDVLLLSGHEEDAAEEEDADEGDAGEVDADSPGSLCVAAGAEAVDGGEGEDEQREHVQFPPQLVADARTQPGADADSDAEVESDDTERHPEGTICAQERDEDFLPAETGERVNPDGQDMHDNEDGAEQGQEVMQFAIEQTRPAAG